MDVTVDTFPFLRMPYELQDRVCALFCRHCLGAASPAGTLAQVAGEPFKTLKALSETCRTLNRIAQPLLFHYPDVKTYTSFFKTVTARPDLAASVRVLAKLYESDHDASSIPPKQLSKEDFTYLKALARRLHIDDPDDPEFDQCFDCIHTSGDGDDHGFTTSMAQAAFASLLTALHFALLPNLEFAMIDLDDGRFIIRYRVLKNKDGALLLPYPYLPKAVSANPQHLLHLDTIVFRNTFHYSPDNLGLERLSFLFAAIPNVRRVFFHSLDGEKPDGYHDPHPDRRCAELEWAALPHIQELYFDPCVRPNDPAPLDGIRNMLQLCTSLKKFTFRLKYPDQYEPALFSPAELLEAVLPAKKTLQHLELYCSFAKIPSFPKETLLRYRLKGLFVLETLVLDEELFCHHWLPDPCDDSCIVDILPDSLTFLTIRMHDKFRTVSDLARLGQSVAKGALPRLSRLRVEILHDILARSDYTTANRNEDAFDAEYHLYDVPWEQWRSTIRGLTEHVAVRVREAFQGTKVAVEVEYVYEHFVAQ